MTAADDHGDAPASGAGRSADLEHDVARIARLVLSSYGLYERMAATLSADAQHERRLLRLRQAVDLGQRALLVAIDQSLNRRRGERRAQGLGRPASRELRGIGLDPAAADGSGHG